jgi:hypothetical protein
MVARLTTSPDEQLSVTDVTSVINATRMMGPSSEY